MNDKVNERNIHTLHDVIKKNVSDISDLKNAVQATNNNMAILQADLQNTKQLIAVLKGVGMGSTVHK